ncbi:MAG: protein-disulfide reductase DsbD family protein [Phycisphaerales bacterium]
MLCTPISSFGTYSARPLAWLLVLTIACILGGAVRPAAAQPDQVLKVRAVAPRTPLTPGERVPVAIVMDFAEGWHIWPNKPVAPPELGDDFSPIPTVITLADFAPVWSSVHLEAVQWPKPHAVSTAGVTGTPIEILSYADQTVAFVPIVIASDAKPGNYSLTFEVAYQACNDSMCRAPASLRAKAAITIAPAGAKSTDTEPDLFKNFDPAVFDSLAPRERGATPATPATGAPLADADDADAESIDSGDAGVLHVRATAEHSPIIPGDRFPVAVELNFDEGWHAWPNKPVPPDGMQDFAAIPTTIELVGPAPAGFHVHLDHTQWPTPHIVTTAGITGTPLDILSYSEQSVAFVPISIGPDARPGQYTLTFRINYQACDDSVCLQPTSATATLALTLADAPVATTPATPALFQGFDGSVFAKLAIAGPANPRPSTPGASPAQASTGPGSAHPRPTLLGFQLPAPDSLLGVFVLFLAAVLGGAILDLTPCVLPVIPIKVMTLTHHAGGSRGKAMMLGIWMALGVVAFWVAVGIPMALLGAVADPSRIIFGTWWVTFVIGLIIAAFSFGIMGLFTLNLPQSVYMVNPQADSPQGSFMFGVMTAVLGLPCFGFVASGLLAVVSVVPPLVTVIIFAGLGIGMAAPYLILSAYPKLVERIPRTGPASELVKQVMGLLLLAAAAYFIAAALKTLLSSKPYLKEAIIWWAVAFFVLLAGTWLTIRTLQIARKTWPKLVMPGLALLGVLGTYAFAAGLTVTARRDYLSQRSALASTQLVPGAWSHWTPANWETAKSSGKVILLDFTADWCITCKVLKGTVLDRDPVLAALGDVIKLEVDLSANDAPGWNFLRDFGRTAVPTLIILKPGGTDPTIMNAYTPANVIAALQSAGVQVAGAKP